MTSRSQKAKLAILKALQELDGAAGAARINEKLQSMGLNLHPRTIRFYLLQLDEEHLTELVSRRRGRILTDEGRQELERANVVDKIGFIAARVDSLTYRMTCSADTGEGTIIANTGLIRSRDLSRSLAVMENIFEHNISMGSRFAVMRSGKPIGSSQVPLGYTAITTVCSLTLNGILLSYGIPVTSRFGGLLEMRNRKPERFVELIEYGGTTTDPLEIFIQAGMTRASDCAKTGNGIIGASFREFPSVARDKVLKLSRKMEQIGLGGLLAIGKPNQPLFDIPVTEGRTGMVVIGGLNPMAALVESGIHLQMHSMAELVDFERFSCFQEIYRQYMDSLR